MILQVAIPRDNRHQHSLPLPIPPASAWQSAHTSHQASQKDHRLDKSTRLRFGDQWRHRGPSLLQPILRGQLMCYPDCGLNVPYMYRYMYIDLN